MLKVFHFSFRFTLQFIKIRDLLWLFIFIIHLKKVLSNLSFPNKKKPDSTTVHFVFELAAQSFGSLIYFNHSKNLLTILFDFLHQRWQLFSSKISKDVNNPSSTYPETSHHSVHALCKKHCHCRGLCHFIPCRSTNAVLCQTISKGDWARVFYKLIQDEEPDALEFLAEYQRHPW